MSIYKGNTVSANQKPRLGINLEDPSYYMAEVPFHNLGKLLSAWVSNSGGGWSNGLPLAFNANGYPSGTLPSGHHAACVLDMGSGHPPGYYNVSWTPSGASLTVDGSVINSYTFLKGTGTSHVQIFRAYSGITNLSVHRSGDTTTDSNQIFQEPFLRRCKNYEVLRFMNWAVTNDNRTAEPTWANRIPSGYYTQSISTNSGTALEYMIDLCNQSQTDMWYCVHHQATDDFVHGAANLIKTRLNPGLKVYLEHSNEIWNSAFQQLAYSTGIGPTGFADPYVRGYAWHVNRTARAAEIFKASGIPTVSVLGTQFANAGFTTYAINQGVQLSGNIDAFTVAPYLGSSFQNNAAMVSGIKSYGINWTLGELWRDMYRQRNYTREWVAVAHTHNKRLVAYEGGQHLAPTVAQHSDAPFVQALVDVNRHQGMYDIYRAFLQMWYEETANELFVLFNSCQPYNQYGSWGLMEYDSQPNSPKYRAVMDHLSYYRPN